MTAYMKPKMTIDDQLTEQQIFAQEGAGNGRGELAVKAANPLLRQQQAQMAGREIDKKLMYGRLGMQKKQQEHDIDMAKGGLDIAKKDLALGQSRYQFGMDQQRKAITLSRYNMGLQLAFGVGNFMQNIKLMRQQEYNQNLVRKLLEQRTRQLEDVENA